jgi:DNA processing protein
MAVPGHPLDSRASGGNILLRDGATLVRGADDVIEALGGACERPRTRGRATAPDTRFAAPKPCRPAAWRRWFSRLSVTPLDEDQLIRDTGQTPRAIAQALAVLEMAGRITRSPGGRVALNGDGVTPENGVFRPGGRGPTASRVRARARPASRG